MDPCFYVDNWFETFFRNKNDWHKFYVSWNAIMQDASHKKTRDHTKRVPDATQEKKQNKQVLLLAEPNEKQIIQKTHK